MPRPKGLPKTGGKPKGYKAPATIEKEAAREIARQRITARLLPLIDAQIDNAIGIQHFFLRDEETGQFRRITKVNEIDKALNAPGAAEGSSYWIYTKDPNPQSAREMLDRALDRSKEQSQTIEVEGGQALIQALLEGRKRAAARKAAARKR